MLPPRDAPGYTAADVVEMPEQWGNLIEVIDGELLVMPYSSLVHQGLLGEFLVMLHNYTREYSFGESSFSPSEIILAPDTLVQPDVFVAPRIEGKRIKEWSDIKTLMLAVEVMAPASIWRDRVMKRYLYQRIGCEYWIVDPDARLVERWLPNDERPDICEERLTWHPEGASVALEIDLVKLFARVLDPRVRA